MIICDSHIHSEFSSDSSAPLDSIIQKAIQLGIPKICLTDHHDIDFPINPELTVLTSNLISIRTLLR